MNAPESNLNTTPTDDEDQVTSSPANIDSPGTVPDNWAGHPDYFQTGKKAGTLKPSRREGGKSKQFDGLNFDGLRATEKVDDLDAPPAPDKKAQKAERKIVEAKIAAKFVMRILDTLTGWISGGTFGADFTDAQRKDRNKYREELEQDWQDYLITLDIPLHPALVAVFGSILYVAPAMQTDKGAERVATFREKIVSKIAVKMFGSKK